MNLINFELIIVDNSYTRICIYSLQLLQAQLSQLKICA